MTVDVNETSGRAKRRARWTMMFVVLFILLVVLLVVNICKGSVDVPLSDVLATFFGGDVSEVSRDIVMDMRFPRALAAIILGGALSLSGYLLQTFFHNPIAGPFVLGISSGAKLVVAIVMIYFLGMGIEIGSGLMIAAAFVGSMISMSFVLLVSKRVQGMGMLIVAGVMIGYICSAITDFIIQFASDSDIANLHNWALGSFSGITWQNVLVMAVVVAVATLCVFLLSKPITAYQLGENYAANMGVNVKRFRAFLVLLSSLLSACVTAFAGPISFVGIAVPQIVKNLFKTAKPILMVPACFVGGGVFCLFCDLLARVAFAPTELSISTMTAIFGAPVVIAVLLRRKREA